MPHPDQVGGVWRQGETRSFDLLNGLLDAQAYRLSYWRVAAEEINYRRFFDVNGLIGVRVEDDRRLFRLDHIGAASAACCTQPRSGEQHDHAGQDPGRHELAHGVGPQHAQGVDLAGVIAEEIQLNQTFSAAVVAGWSAAGRAARTAR